MKIYECMNETIRIGDLIEYCNKAAQIHQELANKSIGRGETAPSAYGAAAYFLQQAEIYKYSIPDIITSMLCEHLEKGEDKEKKAECKMSNDGGWIPVEKEPPPTGCRLQATILHHEWISDYFSDFSESEKTHHPAYAEVYDVIGVGKKWFFMCGIDDYARDEAYIKPKKHISEHVAEIIAWKPLSDPYVPPNKIM